MRDPEYDRFGPWIFEISEQDPVPPLFRPHVTRIDEALLSIKIPRQIDRRDAAPGWNLYDYVICMYEDDFQIWKRNGDDVTTEKFRYTEVVCIKNKEVLLLGELNIITESSSYCFNYNTVSSKIIQQLTGIIREKYDPGRIETAVPRPDIIQTEELDFYFKNLIMQEKKENPAAVLLFCQKNVKLKKAEKSILRKLLFLISAKEILETLHFSDGKELRIITRGMPFKSILKPLYGKEEISIPLTRLKSIAVNSGAVNSGEVHRSERATPPAYNSFTLSTASNTLHFYADKDNPAFPAYPNMLYKYTGTGTAQI